MARKKRWFESDEFWRITGPVLFGQPRITEAPGQVENIIKLLNIKPGMKILDLCCGVGRHALEFARRGYNVTGVDRTSAYLKKAALQAKKENLKVNFVQKDMREFAKPSYFDVVLNFQTSFGYFEDQEDDRRVARNIYKSLKKNGAFIIETSSKEVLARIFTPQDWVERDDFIIMEERKIIDNWSKLYMRWIILRGNEREEVELDFRLYSAAELSALLKDCGFEQIDYYGDLEGNPYDHKAKRMVGVARKL